MSEFRRRLMTQVASDPNALPAGCVRCEYIEATGTQWIDTDKVVYANEDLLLDYELQSMVGNQVIMGWRYEGIYTTTSQCYINYNVSITAPFMVLFFGTSADRSNGVEIMSGVRVRLEVSTRSKKIFIDGVATDGKYDETFTLPYDGEKGSVFNNYLFALNNKGVASATSEVRIYEYSLKDHTGNYTQHLIPILDPNGTPCFYNTVSKKFHYNQGTDTFRFKIAEQ